MSTPKTNLDSVSRADLNQGFRNRMKSHIEAEPRKLFEALELAT